MADGSEIDPRYAAQFQRGFDPAHHAAPPPRRGPVRLEGGPPPTAQRVPDPPPMQPDLPAATPTATHAADVPPSWSLPWWALLALGVGLVVLAAVCAAAAALAPLTANGQTDATTYLVRAAAGPLLVSGALAVTLWAVRLRRSSPRAARSVLIGMAGALLLLLVAAGSEFSRLVGLTAQGPVSSGGIPLPDEALASYLQRLQTAGLLVEVLPWLILAATGALVAAVSLVALEVSSRSPEPGP